MPKYRIAHIKERGVDLIIIPLDAAFGGQTSAEQNQEIAQFQLRAQSAGLAGTVVPVWEENGRLAFIAPRNWHPFFKCLSLAVVQMNLNKELYW